MNILPKILCTAFLATSLLSPSYAQTSEAGKPATSAVSTQVPKADIDWAQDLEKKVRTARYTPSPQEVTRYQSIAAALASRQANATGVTQAEMLWAMEFENKVQNQYRPTSAEFDRYQSIAARLRNDTKK